MKRTPEQQNARNKAANIGGWGYSTSYPRIDASVPLRKIESDVKVEPEKTPKSYTMPIAHPEVIIFDDSLIRRKKQVNF